MIKWNFKNRFPNLIVCSYHVTYAFQSESTLYSCLNFKELLTQSSSHFWSLSGYNGTRTHNHLVRLRTKWFWVRVRLPSLIFFPNVDNRQNRSKSILYSQLITTILSLFLNYFLITSAPPTPSFVARESS